MLLIVLVSHLIVSVSVLFFCSFCLSSLSTRKYVCSPFKASEVISNLRAAHQSGSKNAGFDVRGEGSNVTDAVAAGIIDLYLCKYWGIKLATNAAATALKIDEVGIYFREEVNWCGYWELSGVVIMSGGLLDGY